MRIDKIAVLSQSSVLFFGWFCFIIIMMSQETITPTYALSTDATRRMTTTTTTTSLTNHHQRVVEDGVATDSSSSTGNNNWLVVDFDGTCTDRDTTGLLPRLAAHCQGDSPADYQKRIDIFAQLEQEYFALYQQTMEQRQNPPPLSLEDALGALDEVSNQITEKVSASQILQGLHCSSSSSASSSPTAKEKIAQILLASSCSDPTTNNTGNSQDDNHHHHHHQVEDLSQHVQIRPDCLSVLSQALLTNSWKLGVLSINWCPSLIDVTLIEPVLKMMQQQQLESSTTNIPNKNDNHDKNHVTTRQPQKQQQQPQHQHYGSSGGSEPTTKIPVWSNQVDAQGKVSLLVPGAIAKKERIQAIRQQLSSSSSTKNNARPLVVYVGDSSTDLLALLEADVGILIGHSQSTLAMAEQWNISVRPLGQYDSSSTSTSLLAAIQKSKDSGVGDEKEGAIPTIWQAKDWSEIGHFLRHKI